MFNPLYLVASRHGLYYLRFPIPASFHPERRRSNIRLSLGTRCPKEALHLARGLCYGGERILQSVKSRGMDYQAMRAALTAYFKKHLAQVKEHLQKTGPFSKGFRDSYVQKRERAALALEKGFYNVYPNDDELMGVLRECQLPIRKGSREFELFTNEYLKAYGDICDEALVLNAEFEKYSFSETAPEQVVAVSVPASAKKERKLSEAIKDYTNEKLRLKEWRESSIADYQGKFNLLQEYLGEDAPVEISNELAIDVKNMLLRLPKRYKMVPALRDLSLREVLEKTGYPLLSPSSVNQYLQAYSGFYSWLLKRKEVTENNFTGLLDKVGKTKKPRDFFKPDEIQIIMERLQSISKPHHKWGTLIAFYTGARLNEIAQLEVKDIVTVEGIPCFSLTDEGDDNKRLKNESSRRVVPIHPKLIELGFLDYMKTQRDRVFPQLSYDKNDGYGRNLGRWFNQSLLDKQLGLKTTSLSFHSIRHTVITRLRNAEVPEATVKDIVGHTHNDVTVGVYAKHLDKAVMLRAIEKLNYGVIVEPQGEGLDPLWLNEDELRDYS